MSQDEWPTIIDTVHKELRPDIPAYRCFRAYSVCPRGIITPFSRELWKLYCSCGGTSRLSKPAEFYDLPAIYVEACDIIEAELALWRKVEKQDG